MDLGRPFVKRKSELGLLGTGYSTNNNMDGPNSDIVQNQIVNEEYTLYTTKTV